MNRTQRASLAAHTLALIERGEYQAPSGKTVVIADAVRAMASGTVTYAPEALAALSATAASGGHETRFEVTGETTLAAAARLVAEGEQPLALNFASARNPGGGFLQGSRAQEESLARSSALYASLLLGRTFYDANRTCESCLYTDAMIYSPAVPVFRDDDGALLEAPFPVSFLTAPAANAGALRAGERALLGSTMLRRTGLVLAVAAAQRHRSLVLGAWGCGVFENDPQQVAGWFAAHLGEGGAFAGVFARIVFAVHDHLPGAPTRRAFERAFRRH